LTLADYIDRMNEEADILLAMRRARLGPHRLGWWRGGLNPYSTIHQSTH
jgi:hypothetical protein